jgi:mRNA-degrading endonuclease RelE of RelBE toxin-antitoxin system
LEELVTGGEEEAGTDPADRIGESARRLEEMGVKKINTKIDDPEEIAELGLSEAVESVSINDVADNNEKAVIGLMKVRGEGGKILKTIFAVYPQAKEIQVFVDLVDYENLPEKVKRVLLEATGKLLDKRIRQEEAARLEQQSRKEAQPESSGFLVAATGSEKGPERMAPAAHKRKAQQAVKPNDNAGEETEKEKRLEENLDKYPAFRVEIPAEAWEGFTEEQIRIFEEALEHYRQGGKSMTTIVDVRGKSGGSLLRLRAGDFRLIFEIDEEKKGTINLVATINRRDLRRYLKGL